MEKVSLRDKLDSFSEVWVPKILGELNGQYVKVAKLRGEYVWHYHEDEDELFLILKGQITIQFRDQSIDLKEGEFLIVPRGVEHKPVAVTTAEVLLFEPISTRNTGNVDHHYTIEPERLDTV